MLAGIIFLVMSFPVSLLFHQPAEAAAFSLETAVSGVYEDNILQSPADAGKRGDFYSILSASARVDKEASNNFSFYLKGDAEGFLFRRYHDLDAVSLTVSAGASEELSALLSVEGAVKGAYRNFSDSERTSTAYGGSFELKQQLSFRHWIKEGYEFEKNDADSSLFSYTSHSAVVHSGYLFTPETLLHFGGGFLRRQYGDESKDRIDYITIFGSAIRRIHGSLFANLGYSHQFISTSIQGAGHGDNIYSIGLQYRFR